MSQFVFFSWVQISAFFCNGCLGLMIFCPTLSDVAIITVKGVDHRCAIHGIAKSNAVRFILEENFTLEGYRYI